MNASRQHWHRALDFSAVKDPNSILNAISALLSRRSNSMRPKEIAAWFRGTPREFLMQALDTAVERGFIKCGRSSLNRKRWVLAYWTDNRDE